MFNEFVLLEIWHYDLIVLLLNYHLDLQNEVGLLSKIQHPNIISLLGCSIHGETSFIIYELMQNGSLETQLHGTPNCSCSAL